MQASFVLNDKYIHKSNITDKAAARYPKYCDVSFVIKTTASGLPTQCP